MKKKGLHSVRNFLGSILSSEAHMASRHDQLAAAELGLDL